MPPTPSNWSKSSIEKIAEYVAQKVGYRPGGNIEKVVDKLGGTIVPVDLENLDAADSISIAGPKNFTIRISPISGRLRNHFTIAHELGHYVLHSNFGQVPLRATRSGLPERVEWEANWFAAAFLMPAIAFKAEASKRTVQELAAIFQVSPMAANVRKQALHIF